MIIVYVFFKYLSLNYKHAETIDQYKCALNEIAVLTVAFSIINVFNICQNIAKSCVIMFFTLFLFILPTSAYHTLTINISL